VKNITILRLCYCDTTTDTAGYSSEPLLSAVYLICLIILILLSVGDLKNGARSQREESASLQTLQQW